MKIVEYCDKLGKLEIRDKEKGFFFVCDGKSFIGGITNKKRGIL